LDLYTQVCGPLSHGNPQVVKGILKSYKDCKIIMTAAGVKSNIAESFQQRWGADPDSQLQDSRAQVIEKEF